MQGHYKTFHQLQNKLIQSKNTTSNIHVKQKHDMYNLAGVPRQTSLHIHGIYIYTLSFTQYIMTIYILKLCYRQKTLQKRKKD